MSFGNRYVGWALLAVAVSGCVDRTTQPTGTQAAARNDAVKYWDANASTRWNERALSLVALRPPTNAQAAVSRILTYLSIAQYRAVLAAESELDGPVHPSVSVAVGGASVAVLSAFFPLDATTIEGWLDADAATPGWVGEQNDDPVRGEAIGRRVGATVLAQAASDNYNVASTGTPPVGPGYWVANGPIVRGLHGTRPFFLTAPSQLRVPPPPTFGSRAFVDALAEVRTISDTRTAEQIAIARNWAFATAPFTAGGFNLIAAELIRAHHRNEREATRILAYANAAAFDAQIACWDSKLFYWYIRPSQADPLITLVLALPNHPSYPSGHMCITGAIMSVLIDAFPSERARLEAIITDAALSRIYAGLHYRFDVEAGTAIGRGAAALALAGSLK